MNFREVRARKLRPRRLYRSGDILAIDAAAAGRLIAHYGIRTLVDLRSEREIDKYGSPDTLVRAGIRWHNAPLTGYPSTPIDMPRPSREQTADYLYGVLTQANPPCWPTLLELLADISHEPFLLACHCGKDRTGMAVAATLSLLGVPNDEIAEEYACSATDLVAHVDRFADKWQGRGHTREDYLTRMAVIPPIMSDVLARVNSMSHLLHSLGARPKHLAVVHDNLIAA